MSSGPVSDKDICVVALCEAGSVVQRSNRDGSRSEIIALDITSEAVTAIEVKEPHQCFFRFSKPETHAAPNNDSTRARKKRRVILCPSYGSSLNLTAYEEAQRLKKRLEKLFPFCTRGYQCSIFIALHSKISERHAGRRAAID